MFYYVGIYVWLDVPMCGHSDLWYMYYYAGTYLFEYTFYYVGSYRSEYIYFYGGAYRSEDVWYGYNIPPCLQCKLYVHGVGIVGTKHRPQWFRSVNVREYVEGFPGNQRPEKQWSCECSPDVWASYKHTTYKS